MGWAFEVRNWLWLFTPSSESDLKPYKIGSLSESVGDLKPRDKIKDNKKHRNLLN